MPEIDSEKHRAAGKGQVTLPRWLSKNDVSVILSLIQERSNAEQKWMHDLLGWINTSYEGRTTSELIDLNINIDSIKFDILIRKRFNLIVGSQKLIS